MVSNISEVAVIGAGPSGLAAAKFLLAEKKFAKVQIFEQRDTVAGVWAHNDLTVLDDAFTVPRTQPQEGPDTAIYGPEGKGAPKFVTPVYDFLETNIPHTLMNFNDKCFPPGTSLFPTHRTVRQYLEEYADEIRPIIALFTQVINVVKVPDGDRQRWEVTTQDLITKQTSRACFDAVVVASGHYSDPYIPDIPGLSDFNKTYAGAISHSKFYKNPSDYKDKKVIVVGNSASGIDLSAQISKVSKLPVIVSEKTEPNTPSEEAASWAKHVREISRVVTEDREVHFADGTIEQGVDHIVFCTGYFYSFPFLRQLTPSIETNGSYARNLYQHLIYIHDPTIALIGIPQRVVPFPFGQAQAAWISRVWSGRLALPSQAEMQDWISKTVKEQGESKHLHNLKTPKDIDYINMLFEQSNRAVKVDGLENDGAGKTPPYWGEEKAWTRERFPLIKLASRALGDKRHLVTSLEELGFDFKSYKAGVQQEDKLI
ncbi:thiol-specific monooxygenase [Stachybotrys elegans]|uniref:Thiol-specific monooxygenase n=1 Tax=Stachybotrys elegans TaxID=80388 RepID=A0A8K0WYL4_9HYPO|nr:thiol-specific monooxygenase [Stachybotrys elegans]